MAINNKIPFPQADDFSKIVKVTNIEKEEFLQDKEYLRELLDGISDRQIDYYLNAAKYLGILDENKVFTELGKYIRKINPYMQKVEFVRILMSDVVIGRAYIAGKLMDTKLELDDIKSMIFEEYPNYSEDIYIRRGQTVEKWLDWIDEQFDF